MQQLPSTAPPNKKTRLNHEVLVEDQNSGDRHGDDGAEASAWPATQIINDDQDGAEASTWPATQNANDDQDGAEAWPATQLMNDDQDGAEASTWPATQNVNDRQDGAEAWPATQIMNDVQDGAEASMPATQVINDGQDGAKASLWPAPQIINDEPEGRTASFALAAQMLNNDAPQGPTLSNSASSSQGKEFDLLELVMAWDATSHSSTAAAVLPEAMQPRNYITDEEIYRKVLRDMSTETETHDVEFQRLVQESKSNNLDTALAAMQRLLEMDEVAKPVSVSRPFSSSEVQRKGVYWTSLKRKLGGSTDEQIVSVLHDEIVRHAFLA
jgi:hypothetical protein